MGHLAISGGQPVRKHPIPQWPVHDATEKQRLVEVLDSGDWWYGANVKAFEQEFAAFHGARFGITCTNGSVALDLALRTLGVGPGDEVIVPAYTFIATAIGPVQLNAIPIFCDVEPDTANFDFAAAEQLVTEHTKAVIVVHFAGLPVDLDRARDFCARHNLALIEDSAHAWGSQWEGKGVGAHGQLGTFSFQYTKNITAGEGGILITDNEEHATIARSYTHVGRLEGRAWYEHYLLGTNCRMTEFQAAILRAQLGRLEDQTETRERNAAVLDAALGQIAGIHIPVRHEKVTRRSFHMYLFRYNAAEFGGLPRAAFLEALQAEGIPASPGYLHPVYANPCFRELNSAPRPEHKFLSDLCNERGVRYDQVACPAAEKLCREEAVWLPHVMLLEEPERIRQIVEAVAKVQAHQTEVAVTC